MSKYQSLALWAIPYAARWSLSKVGITVTIPAEGLPTNKVEAAFQQAIGVAAAAVAVAVFVDPTLGMIVGGVLGAIKVYNWIRIDI